MAIDNHRKTDNGKRNCHEFSVWNHTALSSCGSLIIIMGCHSRVSSSTVYTSILGWSWKLILIQINTGGNNLLNKITCSFCLNPLERIQSKINITKTEACLKIFHYIPKFGLAWGILKPFNSNSSKDILLFCKWKKIKWVPLELPKLLVDAVPILSWSSIRLLINIRVSCQGPIHVCDRCSQMGKEGKQFFVFIWDAFFFF